MESDETPSTSTAPTHVWPKRGGLAIWSQLNESRELIARVGLASPLRVLGEHARYYQVAIPTDETTGFVLKDAVAESRDQATRSAQAEGDQASAYVDSEDWTPATEQQPYASFGRRAVGFLLDFVTDIGFLVAIPLVLRPFLASGQTQDSVDNLAFSALAVVLLLYGWIGNSYGLTLGKWVVGIRVVADATGESPGLRRCGLRFVASFGSGLALYLGYVMDQNGKTWHDRVAGTSVVPRRNIKKIGDA